MAVERRLGTFIALTLAKTAWAFATATLSDVTLFALLAKAVERRPGTFTALTAWAFGTAT